MSQDLTAEELERVWQAWKTKVQPLEPTEAMNLTRYVGRFEYDGAVWARSHKPLPIRDGTISARIVVFTSSDGRHIGGELDEMSFDQVNRLR
jgi:hypothetical protein